jgi:2-keto-4-pentenoate hydratase/2-oxohepta-3-ene-1,7-dioic acid hydratase in catechol pathway
LCLLETKGRIVVAGERAGTLRDLSEAGLSDSISEIMSSADLRQSAERHLANAPEIDSLEATFLPPLPRPSKIICVGLNYADHAAESPYDRPSWPVFFLRVPSSLVGHRQPILKPAVSDDLDYEAEMVAVIGKPGRSIAEKDALDHVVGYSVFNDGSIRDYQLKKGPQWTVGKNFDATGGFGPFVVSADELPAGGKGLSVSTRLNGKIMQQANTDDMLFPVAELVARVSEAMTLEAGDIIVTGTPAGVGFARKPPVFMRDGDLCEIEIEGIGTLSNPVRNDPRGC